MLFKKSVSPVVASLLLVTMAIVVGVYVFNWYSDYTTGVTRDISEKQYSKDIRTDYVGKNVLYGYNEYNNFKPDKVLIDGNECEILNSDDEFSKGTFEIQFDESCSQGLTSSMNEILIITDKGSYKSLLSVSDATYTYGDNSGGGSNDGGGSDDDNGGGDDNDGGNNDNDDNGGDTGGGDTINYCSSGSVEHNSITFAYGTIEDTKSSKLEKTEIRTEETEIHYITVTCNYPNVIKDENSYYSEITCNLGYEKNTEGTACIETTTDQTFCPAQSSYIHNGITFIYEYETQNNEEVQITQSEGIEGGFKYHTSSATCNSPNLIYVENSYTTSVLCTESGYEPDGLGGCKLSQAPMCSAGSGSILGIDFPSYSYYYEHEEIEQDKVFYDGDTTPLQSGNGYIDYQIGITCSDSNLDLVSPEVKSEILYCDENNDYFLNEDGTDCEKRITTCPASEGIHTEEGVDYYYEFDELQLNEISDPVYQGEVEIENGYRYYTISSYCNNPPNFHLNPTLGDISRCNEDYEEVGDSCVLKQTYCPPQSSYTYNGISFTYDYETENNQEVEITQSETIFGGFIYHKSNATCISPNLEYKEGSYDTELWCDEDGGFEPDGLGGCKESVAPMCFGENYIFGIDFPTYNYYYNYSNLEQNDVGYYGDLKELNSGLGYIDYNINITCSNANSNIVSPIILEETIYCYDDLNYKVNDLGTDCEKRITSCTLEDGVYTKDSVDYPYSFSEELEKGSDPILYNNKIRISYGHQDYTISAICTNPPEENLTLSLGDITCDPNYREENGVCVKDICEDKSGTYKRFSWSFDDYLVRNSEEIYDSEGKEFIAVPDGVSSYELEITCKDDLTIEEKLIDLKCSVGYLDINDNCEINHCPQNDMSVNLVTGTSQTFTHKKLFFDDTEGDKFEIKTKTDDIDKGFIQHDITFSCDFPREDPNVNITYEYFGDCDNKEEYIFDETSLSCKESFCRGPYTHNGIYDPTQTVEFDFTEILHDRDQTLTSSYDVYGGTIDATINLYCLNAQIYDRSSYTETLECNSPQFIEENGKCIENTCEPPDSGTYNGIYDWSLGSSLNKGNSEISSQTSSNIEGVDWYKINMTCNENLNIVPTLYDLQCSEGYLEDGESCIRNYCPQNDNILVDTTTGSKSFSHSELSFEEWETKYKTEQITGGEILHEATFTCNYPTNDAPNNVDIDYEDFPVCDNSMEYKYNSVSNSCEPSFCSGPYTRNGIYDSTKTVEFDFDKILDQNRDTFEGNYSVSGGIVDVNLTLYCSNTVPSEISYTENLECDTGFRKEGNVCVKNVCEAQEGYHGEYYWSFEDDLDLGTNTTYEGKSDELPKGVSSYEVKMVCDLNGNLNTDLISVECLEGYPLNSADDVCEDYFIFLWDTTKITDGSSGKKQIRLPLEDSGIYNFVVDWGDGNQETITSYHKAIHTYLEEGEYEVKIKGIIEGFRFNNGGDRNKILDINRYGPLNLGNSGSYFMGAENLGISATDKLDLSETTNFNEIFAYTKGFNGDLSSWDTSNVEDMRYMFSNSDNFNGDLSSWDTSNVEDMRYMFSGTTNFEGDLSNWDFSGLSGAGRYYIDKVFQNSNNFKGDLSNWDLSGMDILDIFKTTNNFNGDLSNWNVSGDDSFQMMFNYVDNFNGDLSNWDISNRDIRGIFQNSNNFTGDLRNWNIPVSTNFEGMFQNSNNFKGDLRSWNISGVTSLKKMFQNSNNFKGDLSNWDTSNVKDMSNMFSNTINFDGKLYDWDTSNVEDMGYMFYNVADFNFHYTMGYWNTSSVTSMSGLFSGSDNFDGNLRNWDTSSVTSMSYMFSSSDNFDEDFLYYWDTSSVISMNGMFSGSDNFDSPIWRWDTSNVKYMSSMFSYTTNFGSSVSSWNTSSVEDMGSLLKSSDSFSQNLRSWDTSSVTNMNYFADNIKNFNQDLSSWDTSNVNRCMNFDYNADWLDQYKPILNC